MEVCEHYGSAPNSLSFLVNACGAEHIKNLMTLKKFGIGLQGKELVKSSAIRDQALQNLPWITAIAFM